MWAFSIIRRAVACANLGGHAYAGRLERLHKGQEPLRVVDLEVLKLELHKTRQGKAVGSVQPDSSARNERQ